MLPHSRVLAGLTCACSLLLALMPARAFAVPGPDSTAVVANGDDPESTKLARAYASARQIPDRQVCIVRAVPKGAFIRFDQYLAIEKQIQRCLFDGGVLPRIEAIVLARGIPRMVEVGGGPGAGRVSFPAALATWKSVWLKDGTRLLGKPPGRCLGLHCLLAPRWPNPFRKGVFEPGWSKKSEDGAVLWRPLLVTVLDGYSYADAARLFESALRAERVGGARGRFLFMNGADPARSALDGEYDRVMAGLRARGYTDVARVPFASDLTGLTIAAFFTGTPTLGQTIEGNTFAPGALVDNLTSCGATPVNFNPPDPKKPHSECQVSIARWVARGVAGVHGTVAEPLTISFPSRALILDYVDGSTLAEAFFRNMPYVYWRNVVLGDPMAVPYARRPVVTFEGLETGTRVFSATHRIKVRAINPAGGAIGTTHLYVDGVEVAGSKDGHLEACVGIPRSEGKELPLLAVAQTADDGSPSARYRPKGWKEIRVRAIGTFPTAPCPPRILETSAGVGTAIIMWSAPADGGSSIQEYRVTASPGGATVRVPGSSVRTTIRGLTHKSVYTFQVTATSAIGTSAPSAPSEKVIPK
jgi:uncharacterized protein (TIGR03790 family)